MQVPVLDYEMNAETLVCCRMKHCLLRSITCSAGTAVFIEIFVFHKRLMLNSIEFIHPAAILELQQDLSGAAFCRVSVSCNFSGRKHFNFTTYIISVSIWHFAIILSLHVWNLHIFVLSGTTKWLILEFLTLYSVILQNSKLWRQVGLQKKKNKKLKAETSI